MKPRLFWTMLLAFSLVIVLGVCGMLSFFGMAVAGVMPQESHLAPAEVQSGVTAFLADYYIANDNSWVGIDQRLQSFSNSGPFSFFRYTVVDANGRVVASTNPVQRPGRSVGRVELMHGMPIVARGRRVGTVLLYSGVMPDAPRGSSTFFWSVVRGFFGAGLGLALALLALAVIFTRWLSRPLRRLMDASQALASGQLDVRVAGAPVRELDDLARSFNTMAAALSESDRQRRQMTADIAHELRTPLTIIKGRLEGLQDGIYQTTPEQVERLLDETALLERLIEDLRLLALAEAGQLPLYRELIDPRDLLDDAAGAFAAQAASHGVTLRVEAADLPPIDADPQRLAQVLANLVANALRYTPAGGTISLRASYKSDPGIPDRVLIQVADTGHGIPAADLPHIFDRFWRADRARTRIAGGAGLGLAIARQIVVAHGGTIWAESAEGQGTLISMTLPIADEEPWLDIPIA